MPSLLTIHGLTSFKKRFPSLRNSIDYIYEMLGRSCTFYICNWYLNNLFLPRFFFISTVISCIIRRAIRSYVKNIAPASEGLQDGCKIRVQIILFAFHLHNDCPYRLACVLKQQSHVHSYLHPEYNKKMVFLPRFTTFPVFRIKAPGHAATAADWHRVVAHLDWINISIQMCGKKIRIPQDLIKLSPVSPFYCEGFRV